MISNEEEGGRGAIPISQVKQPKITEAGYLSYV